MSNQPLAKGRVCYASEYYATNERDQNGKPKMKARYATLGRATMWPAERQGEPPQISIDLDSIPIGSTGAIKMMVFWDQPQQQPPANTGGYQHPNTPPHPEPQPQSYGSWRTPPQS